MNVLTLLTVIALGLATAACTPSSGSEGGESLDSMDEGVAAGEGLGDLASSDAGPCEFVDFEDPALEAVVRASLGIESGPITGDVILGLDEVVMGGVFSLQGLECAQNLRVLAAHVDGLEDLSPLANLSELEELELNGDVGFPGPAQGLIDISPLGGLTKLRQLDLGHNAIVDLTPLAGLGELEFLALPGNAITDFSPLAEIPAPRDLILGANPITDISPLTNFSELGSVTFIASEITDLSPLIGVQWDTPWGCADLAFLTATLSEADVTEHIPQICAANPGIAVWGPSPEQAPCNAQLSCRCPGDWFCE